MRINKCRSCDGNRDELSFEELSLKHQKDWEESVMKGEEEYFLVCPECDELSAIFEVEKH